MAQAQAPHAAPAADARWEVGVELLALRPKPSPTPVPLITNTYADVPGAQVLLGGGAVDTGHRPGLRVQAAYRIGDQLSLALSGSHQPPRRETAAVQSSGQPGSVDLLLPYVDARTGREDVTEISYWPEYRGSAQATLSSRLDSAELALAWAFPARGGLQIALSGGLRWLHLRESYTIRTSSPYIPPNPADIWNTTDRFAASNRFAGLQTGVRASFSRGRWSGQLSGTLALGTLRQQVHVAGWLDTNDYNGFGPVQRFAGGYFALPSNGGVHRRQRSAVLPELRAQVGVQLTRQATLLASFAALSLRDVARPGLQIDRVLDPTQNVAHGNDPPVAVSDAARPAFRFRGAAYTQQSLGLGLVWRFD